jgi:hypothetical protein
MPSSYTANGGIELPANGEQSGTWGETVNDNMSIIDRLTNGVGSISLSGTTHTLTTNNGSLSEGQYKVLLLGGSPSGTNTITVSPNTGQHIYIVTNSSGQTATFTQGSGGNVSVLNGTTKILSTNGAGGGAAVVDITAAIDLGALIIGGTTITSSAAELNILDGVTATTAELNILDGVTATAAELNLVDGSSAGTIVNDKAVIYSAAGQVNATSLAVGGTEITSTPAELNILDGATLSTAELNYVTGVTSAIQTQIDTKAPSASPTLTSPTLASVITVTGGTQSWTVTAAGTNLTFAYNGTNVMRVDSTGNITAIGNVTAYGSVV